MKSGAAVTHIDLIAIIDIQQFSFLNKLPFATVYVKHFSYNLITLHNVRRTILIKMQSLLRKSLIQKLYEKKN